VRDLVAGARAGDQAAWDRIVERYAPLVWGLCRRYGLAPTDAEDVGACVWLRLVERLDTLREPAALPGWLATTTRHECLRVLRTRTRHLPVDEPADLVDGTQAAVDEWLLTQERHIALRAAFAALPERCRRLLALLFTDPPTPYAEIVTVMGMAVGAIGPTRQRCLERLRAAPELAALRDPAAAREGG
jgi:RNA polymerase sigma factor (sigma-70 family)